MGNGNSVNDTDILEEYDIDEDAIVTSSHWTLHHASCRAKDHAAKRPSQLSVFIGPNRYIEPMKKNLSSYRHPSILKYAASARDSQISYLFTEKAVVLPVVLAHQDSLQVCRGLYDVISALAFLHSRGNVCHNNVAVSSIFVTPDGNWKLSGLELTTKFENVNDELLMAIRTNGQILAPEDEHGYQANPALSEKRDVYALGKVVQEVLQSGGRGDRASSYSAEFLEYARTELCNVEAHRRPSMTDILEHSYFKEQDYVTIVSFLQNLPCHNKSERAQFYQCLVAKLDKIPEKLIARQLTKLLLSRMVLLDDEAVEHLLPHLLTPRSGDETKRDHQDPPTHPLLSMEMFKENVVPLLIKVFKVRDVHIRLVLLRFFSNFAPAFGADELEDEILPQVLLGIRDNTNDELVAETLRTLAYLVPVLGSAKVIGDKYRKKIFFDGQPGTTSSTDTSISKDYALSAAPEAERQSPIGAEHDASLDLDYSSKQPVLNQDFERAFGTSDGWGEWDTESLDDEGPKPTFAETSSSSKMLSSKDEAHDNDANDFFADMEPVISSAKKVSLHDTVMSSKFAVAVDDNDEGDDGQCGWDDE